jgi:hypothetical protein
MAIGPHGRLRQAQGFLGVPGSQSLAVVSTPASAACATGRTTRVAGAGGGLWSKPHP